MPAVTRHWIALPSSAAVSVYSLPVAPEIARRCAATGSCIRSGFRSSVPSAHASFSPALAATPVDRLVSRSEAPVARSVGAVLMTLVELSTIALPLALVPVTWHCTTVPLSALAKQVFFAGGASDPSTVAQPLTRKGRDYRSTYP